jgi:hypothetical protein
MDEKNLLADPRYLNIDSIEFIGLIVFAGLPVSAPLKNDNPY